jgi:hypothetical protein
MNEFNDNREILNDIARPPILQKGLEDVSANDYAGEKSFFEAFGDAITAFVDTLKEFFNSGNKEAEEFDESYVEKASEVMAEVFDEKTINEWGSMSLEQRSEKLDEYYSKLGDALGIDAKGIIVEDCWATSGEGVMGYAGGDGYLHIDYRNIQDPEKLFEVLNTTTHEARHQLQFEAIEDPSRFPELSPALISEWEHNFINYDDGAFGYEGYYNQVVEVDARVFAADVLDAYKNKMGL